MGGTIRQREELEAMEAFVRQQEREGGVHTSAWPASWNEAQTLGIEAEEEDVRMGVIWVGYTDLIKNGRRIIVIVLPVRYPMEQPRLWIHELAGFAKHRVVGQRRACLTIPDWSPDRSIAGLLAEGLQAFVADINQKSSIMVPR